MATLASKSLALRQFAESELTPSDEYTSRGNELADKIFNYMRSKTSYINRVCISGSMGKRTSLGADQEPDFDLVLFCNGKEPPFRSVVQDFKRILQDTNVQIVRSNDHMIHVKWQNYNFDICPAPNFISTAGHFDTATYERQRDAVYARIRRSAFPLQEANNLSTGLAESARKFLQMQSSFTHSVVRLAKYWNKSVPVGHFPGRKLLIETIAIEAAREAEAGSVEMYRALESFLRKMLDFDGLRCVFLMHYKETDIPATLRNKRPLVLDPANPWNNLADNVPPAARLAFRQRSNATLANLALIGQVDIKSILG